MLFTDNKIVISIDNDYHTYSIDSHKFVINGFKNKTDKEIKKFFANKIRQIIKREGIVNKSKKFGWRKNNKQISEYIGVGGDGIAISDAITAYNNLLSE